MRHVFDEVSKCLIDRDDEIEAILVCTIANVHGCLIGPPGTGKSMICDSIGTALGVKVWDVLMNEFTTPDEFLGPINLDGLKASPSRFERVTTDMFPECHIAFLDEVNNASGAIKDMLLKSMNERRIRIGQNNINIPLKSMIGATNHDFEPGRMDAFADRWLIKMHVEPISTKHWDDLLFGSLPTPTQVSSLQELEAATAQAKAMAFNQDAKQAYKQIMMELRAASICPSDRRCRSAISVCQAKAVLDGDTVVEPKHLEILKYAMFTHEKERVRAEEIVTKIANPAASELQSQMLVIQEVLDSNESNAVKAGQLRQVKQKVMALKDSRRSQKVLSELEDHITKFVMADLEIDNLPPPPPVSHVA